MKNTLITLSLALLTSSAFARGFDDCGLIQDSIEKRVRDCSSQPESAITTQQGIKWQLVSRKSLTQYSSKDEVSNEVWLDSATGLVWGAELLDPASWNIRATFTFDNALKVGSACEFQQDRFSSSRGDVIQCNVLEETACKSASGIQSVNNISEKSFGVPTVAELDEANSHGFKEILQRSGGALMNPLWTSSLAPSVSDNPPNKSYLAFIGTYTGASPGGETGSCYFAGCTTRTSLESVRCVGR